MASWIRSFHCGQLQNMLARQLVTVARKPKETVAACIGATADVESQFMPTRSVPLSEMSELSTCVFRIVSLGSAKLCA